MTSPGPVEMDASMQSLAKRLADNDAKIRAKALKDISTKIRSVEDNLPSIEMMKLWKGIFYCLWMSDKRVVQNDLSDRLAALTLSLKSETLALSYIECFWRTMIREWSGIDYLRLDKFYYVCRRMLATTGDLLDKNGYTQEFVEKYGEMMEKHPLNPEFGKVPTGITYFVCENYNIVFEGNGICKPSAMNKVEILAPIFNIMMVTHSALVLDKIMTGLFDPVLEEGAEDEAKYAWTEEELTVLATCLLMMMDDENIPDAAVDRLAKILNPLAEKFGGIESLLVKINGPDCLNELEEAEEAEEVTQEMETEEQDVPQLIPVQTETPETPEAKPDSPKSSLKVNFKEVKEVRKFDKKLPPTEIEREILLEDVIQTKKVKKMKNKGTKRRNVIHIRTIEAPSKKQKKTRPVAADFM